MQHVVRFLEDKLTAGDFLVSLLSNILLHVCLLPPDTIPTRIWHNIACVEEALWKYLSISSEPPTIEQYLSVYGLLKLLEYRIVKFRSVKDTSTPTLPSITTQEPLVQRWIPKTIPALDPTVYERYRLLIKPAAANDLPARFLVGIADAFVHAANADFRGLIQTLARKRTEIDLPSQWPIPAYVHHDRTDPAWFIWGILMHLWPKRTQQWLMTKFKIYTWNYKGKTSKLNRLGILCCVEQRMAEILATFTPSEDHMEFSVADLHMIETALEEGVAYAEKMELQLTHTAPKKEPDNQLERLQKDHFYLNFIPRRTTDTEVNAAEAEPEPDTSMSKYIDVDG